MLNFSIQPTNITLPLLKCCKTVTSEEVNATKIFTDRINKHVQIQSNLKKETFHRMNRASNFLGRSFSNRDNLDNVRAMETMQDP